MNIAAYAPLIVQGTSVTLAAWLFSACISFAVGTVLGIMSCRYMNLRSWRMLIACYTFVAKGVPAYVQILIAYFVVPALVGINVSGFVAAVCALAFCSSGYVAEMVRAGINTVPRGQWEACYVLGYPLQATLMRVILPQTCTNILPGLLGEAEQLLKSSSLLATIGVTELTRSGANIISREMNPIPVYLLIAVIYLMFSALLHIVSIYYAQRGGCYARRS